MKKILLLLLIVTLILSCSSDDDTEGREMTKLKSEKITTDYINEFGNHIKYESIYDYYYGANGYVESIKNTGIFPNKTIEKNEYLYYEGNKVVRRKYSPIFESKIEIDEKYTYENDLIVELNDESSNYKRNKYYYDTSKNLIKAEYYSSNSGEEFILDLVIEYEYKDGNAIKQYVMHKHSNETDIITYEYDDKDIPTNNSFPEAFNKIMNLSKNNIIKRHNEDSELIKEYKYEYDSKGYPIKATYDNGNMTVLYEYY